MPRTVNPPRCTRLTIFSSVQFPVCRKPQRSAQPTTNFSVGSVPHRGAVSASLGRLELGSRVPIEYQKPNGHNICMTRSGVTSTRELYCTVRTVHALTVRCTVWLVLDRQTSDLLLPGQRGRCEQRPEVRRRRPLLRAQVEAQVCGAERHGLSGAIGSLGNVEQRSDTTGRGTYGEPSSTCCLMDGVEQQYISLVSIARLRHGGRHTRTIVSTSQSKSRPSV